MSKYPATIQDIGNIRRVASQEHCWTAPFIIILIFVFFEISRLPHTFPFLQPLRILLVATILLSAILFLKLLSGQLNTDDPHIKLVLMFFMLMALHIPFAYNNMSAYGKTLTLLPYVLLILGIVNFTRSIKQLVILIHLWLFLHVYLAVYAITHNGRGPGGYFGDENDVGVALVMVIPVAYFLLTGSKGFNRMKYALCLIILLLGLIFTFSRGGFVGLVFVVLYCVWRSRSRVAVLIGIGLILLILIPFAPTGYVDEMETLQQGSQENTAAHRLFLWKIAWKMFLDNPLWGVGPGSWKYAVSRYQPPGGYHGMGQGGRSIHSTHFQLLSELALPGLIIFGMLIYMHFRSVFGIAHQGSRSAKIPTKGLRTVQDVLEIRREFLRFAAIGFGGGLVGYLTAGLFVTVLYEPHFWIFSGIMIALHQVWQRRNESVDFDLRLKTDEDFRVKPGGLFSK